MKRLYYISLAVFLLIILLIPGCVGRSETLLEGKWKVIEVKGTSPDIFMNEVWEFKDNRYSVKGLSLSGNFGLGTDGDNNAIMFFPKNKTAVRSAGIYKIRENGEELIMKLGNAENDKPNFPEDFTADITWYDVYVCEKQ